ncbi:MAG: hypothetical protein M0Z46_17105 [Actinomycetota bacterium]|nr:hypothetical protein [Actinomycetota bacterium]
MPPSAGAPRRAQLCPLRSDHTAGGQASQRLWFAGVYVPGVVGSEGESRCPTIRRTPSGAMFPSDLKVGVGVLVQAR